jgi:hypothetical protein
LIAGIAVLLLALIVGAVWMMRSAPPTTEVVAPPPATKAPEVIAAPAKELAPGLDVAKSAELFNDGEKVLARAGSDDGLSVGVEVRIVGAAGLDGKRPLLGKATVLEVFPKMARLSLDEAAARATGEKSVALEVAVVKPAAPVVEVKRVDGPKPGVKVALNAQLNLVQEPKRAVRLKNNGSFTFTRCSVIIPGQRQADFASLPAGMSREIVLDHFVENTSAAALENQVRLNCAQGSITLPAQ